MNGHDYFSLCRRDLRRSCGASPANLGSCIPKANDRPSASHDAASALDGGPMSADPLSDVLRTVRLTGATFFEVAACAPWAAEQPPREVVLPKVLPGGQHLVSYHVVTEGSCYAATHRRGADAARGRRGHRLHQRRRACDVERARHARPAGDAGRIRRQSPPARCRSSPTTAPARARRRPSWCAASSPAMRTRSTR